ncbi:MAG: sugar phosphate isomerase/epimerase [Rubrobacteraceae bacterium]
MKLGLFTVPLGDLPLPEALEYATSLGCGVVELGAGGYPGRDHCDPKGLLANPEALEDFKRTVAESGVGISALSCHGNPLHPDQSLARTHDEDFRNAVRLASELEVDTVVTFSGCPGDSEGSERPNWVTCAWPPDFLEILEWQWNEKVAPYWQEASGFAGEHGVKVAIEPHPGFVVYNTGTFRRLRALAGDDIGVNLDPSNLFWQRIDPVACAGELGDAIFHVHAKDTGLNPDRVAMDGVLDTKEHTPDGERAWVYKVVGRGHGEDFWGALIQTLYNVGYEGAISIEHEDLAVDPKAGFGEAADLLSSALGNIETTPGRRDQEV